MNIKKLIEKIFKYCFHNYIYLETRFDRSFDGHDMIICYKCSKCGKTIEENNH